MNLVTQLQMHEALQSIKVHNLFKIMLNNLLGLASHNEFTETNHQHRQMLRLQITVWNLGLLCQR